MNPRRVRDLAAGIARHLRVRLSVRLRLALLSAGLAVLAGVLVLAVTYFLVSRPLLFVRTGLAVRIVGVETATPDQLPAAVQKALGSLKVQQALATLKKAAAQAKNGSTPDLPPTNVAQVRPGAVGQAAPPRNLLFVAKQISNAQRAADMGSLLKRGGLALALLAALAAGVGWWLAGRMLHPLQVMTRRVRALSGQTPLGRIGLQGPSDELKDLADTFDGLLGRLDASSAIERRFVANASHELRTPLAIQETLLDVGLSDPAADVASLREMAGRLRQVNQRSKRLIEGLLALARSQQGLTHAEPVDLAVVTRDAVEALIPEAAARGVRIQSDLRPGAVRGDPVLLEHLAGNLVENAVRHNSRGGWVRVATSGDGGQVALTVVNSGPRVEPAQVAELFEPFRRGVRERTATNRGAGLGLSIVEAVATVHGGTVVAQARPEGGLTVRVEIPATDGRVVAATARPATDP